MRLGELPLPLMWGCRVIFGADVGQLVTRLGSVRPALLFGLRLWVSVCLALYIAFWLELDNDVLGRHVGGGRSCVSRSWARRCARGGSA
jgi:hypothetical protein